MVVLVDSDTASASEIVTAALQDHHRATVVGTHTFGKGVFQEEEPLSNGGALDITVGEYFTPNGRNLGGGGVKQGAGITPEVPLANNVVDTPRGLDVALKRSPRKSVSPPPSAGRSWRRAGEARARCLPRRSRCFPRHARLSGGPRSRALAGRLSARLHRARGRWADGAHGRPGARAAGRTR